MKAIGVDIGGTGVKGSIVTLSGEVIKTCKVVTNVSNGREGVLSSLFQVIDQLITDEVVGIGVGTAGRVNVQTGEVVFATSNLPGWQGVNLINEVNKRYDLPCEVENDANAALVGELWQGAAKDSSYFSVTMLTLGTGVGGANSLNGNIIQGGHCQSGEWGHMVFVPNGRLCNCGMKGCLEQYLSGTALVKVANEITGATFRHGEEIFQAYREGSKLVAPVVETYIDHLALAIYNVSVSLDPDAVIIGGGVIDSKEVWWDLLVEKLANYHVILTVAPALLGNKAGMLGAAKLLFDGVRKRSEPMCKEIR